MIITVSMDTGFPRGLLAVTRKGWSGFASDAVRVFNGGFHVYVTFDPVVQQRVNSIESSIAIALKNNVRSNS